jgi:hypothetical protein
MSLDGDYSLYPSGDFSVRDLIAKVDNMTRLNLDFVRPGVSGPMDSLSLCETRRGEETGNNLLK